MRQPAQRDELSLPPGLAAALPGPAATAELGARLLGPLARRACAQPDGAMLLLSGPLGAGKSALARGLLRAAGVAGPVPSPTFTLVEPYRSGRLRIFHLDLYRLGDASELELLGFSDMRERGALVLIEWPERAPELAAAADLEVRLAYRDASRLARLRGAPDLLAALPRLDYAA